ncbi:MAG: hypothetical protein AB7H66_10870 [Hyphomonadaceae bacterium]
MINMMFAGIMVVSGLLTLTMLYAAAAPIAAAQSFFGETPDGAFASIVVPNWGILIGLMGALLIYGAFKPSARKLALVVAGASKVAFVALILAQGDRYIDSLGVAVVVDSVMVVLFAAYVMFGKPG